MNKKWYESAPGAACIIRISFAIGVALTVILVLSGIVMGFTANQNAQSFVASGLGFFTAGGAAKVWQKMHEGKNDQNNNDRQ